MLNESFFLSLSGYIEKPVGVARAGVVARWLKSLPFCLSLESCVPLRTRREKTHRFYSVGGVDIPIVAVDAAA